jgi:hypothetical protein
MEKRPESRVTADIPVRVWGMDADGKPFFQSGLAGSLSSEGAQLTHLHHCLKAGDIIGIQYGEKKARFKVIWANASVAPRKNKAGVLILPDQTAPWTDIAAETSIKPKGTGSDKRRFSRHRVQFPIEISFEDARRAHMQCSATDIGGRGCYIETWESSSLLLKVTFRSACKNTSKRWTRDFRGRRTKASDLFTRHCQNPNLCRAFPIE